MTDGSSHLKKIRVIVDTSTLRRDPSRKGVGLRSLSFYSKNGYLEICVPSIVRDEFLSQEVGTLKKHISSSLISLKSIIASGQSERDFVEIKGFLEYIESRQYNLENSPSLRFYNWVRKSKVKILEVNFDHFQSVLRSYFSGLPPFSDIKSRKDIPDSLVYETIAEIKLELGTVLFICADSNLRDAVEKNLNIEVFDSTESFFKSDIANGIIESSANQIELERIRSINKNFNRYMHIILSNVLFLVAPQIEKFDRIKIDAIAPTDAQIISFSGLRLEDLSADSITYYSENKFSFDYKGEVDLQLNYIIPTDHFQRLSNSSREVSGTGVGESSVSATEAITAKVTGSIVMTVASGDWGDLHLEDSNLESAFQNSDFKIKNFFIETGKYDRTEYDEYDLYSEDIDASDYEEDLLTEYYSSIPESMDPSDSKSLHRYMDDDLPF